MSEIQEAKWYVVHTYSGHENKVKATIEKAVKTRGMEDCIRQVIVPTEDVIETTKVKEKIKDNGEVKEVVKEKTKIRQRKIYPSYVLINMMITDESWYIVRNTKGVTGFVGPGSKPVPLSDAEVEAMGINSNKIGENRVEIEIGDLVKVCDGSFKGQSGIVKQIDAKNKIAKVCLDGCGNELSLEVELKSIERI